jgi:hypothetical protein
VEEGAVVLHQRDGSIVAFEEMECHKQMFLIRMNLFQEIASKSDVLDAVRNATPESRAAFEERFGSISMTEYIISGWEGWVKVLVLTQEGQVKTIFHEGGSKEAERIRREACGAL